MAKTGRQDLIPAILLATTCFEGFRLQRLQIYNRRLHAPRRHYGVNQSVNGLPLTFISNENTVQLFDVPRSFILVILLVSRL